MNIHEIDTLFRNFIPGTTIAHVATLVNNIRHMILSGQHN